MSSCKGCIWYNDCHDVRCEIYDNDNEEYGWNEMSYNLLNDVVRKDLYETSEMIDWYNSNVAKD